MGMVSIAVFFSYDIQIQSLLATLLCVTALCVHALACPYVTDAMDGLELLSLFGSFIIVIVNMAVMIAIFAMLIGEGVGMVTRFGKKLRNILCCRKNKPAAVAKPDGVDGTLGVQAPNNVLEEKGNAISSPREKRKKKPRDDDEYGNIDYANIDYSNDDNSQQSKQIRLQSDLHDIPMQEMLYDYAEETEEEIL